ncbi:MAG: bifunctional DNA-formamidopyrimidine glycosylase/DNA-(apurinic or apyrimidinic site) lyase [candidate division NC10 bacterium]|nr:bifunctional DNA-formamidopyrimidine glycosylase/DNA-(apurinic or apyrimidinic site) lyase [candidate division NC10 bacterium]MBI2164151.1 bifunctional DNA-formamidopyrimidine glycosylase/DNA-(apurinic or apyrimidinic site) lyase [candidate division NC10 bacterium]MBI2457938.1 bifunctional DNA-formamidopyrimidine glycosylase/DNA-(apurinic or apyrimidinic site) lyase [candidate division NC10 bacterium]MBI3121457.1 bifunctional DNA-formamidopyrimidine glycosylase/DNA-(apurinic or apyrimidinic s
MPELPEVEVIRRDLVPHVEGRRIRSAKITESRLTRRRGSPREVEAALVGQRVKALRRRGKFFVFDLGRDSLVVRLGMTGQLLWWGSEDRFRPDQHTHAQLVIAGGGILSYRDIRKFGEMFILPTASLEQMLRLGVEPLGPAFTAEALRRICRGSTRIKSLLLDQTKIAGIGNIYADEALFRAGIRPTRRANSLRLEEIRSLQRAIRAILQAGIRHRGSSIANYRDPCGQPGRFVALHRVYHRQGKPCLSCGTPVRRIVLGQRGTHFCPTCQR